MENDPPLHRAELWVFGVLLRDGFESQGLRGQG